MATTKIIYRDKKTGRFVSSKTWKRSKAKGGKRYVRKTVGVVRHRAVKRKRPFVAPIVEPLPHPEEMEKFEEIELIGGFDSPGRKRK